jgi:hypothetical protein
MASACFPNLKEFKTWLKFLCVKVVLLLLLETKGGGETKTLLLLWTTTIHGVLKN